MPFQRLVLSAAVLTMLGTCVLSNAAGPAKPVVSRTPLEEAVKSPPTTLNQALAPTLVSFQCKDSPANDALQDLSKTLGFPLISRFDSRKIESSKKITCDDTNKPFWAVIADVANQDNIEICPNLADAQLPFVLINRQPGYTPFLYMPHDVNSAIVPAITDVAFPRFAKKDAKLDRMEVQLQLLTEPKIFIAGYSRPCKIDQAIDDRGSSLIFPLSPREVAAEGGGPQFEPVDKITVVNTSFTLKYPPAPAKTIAKLRGSVVVTVGLDLHTVDLTPVLSGTPMSLPIGRSASIKFSDFGLSKRGNSYEMHVSVPRINAGNGKMLSMTPEFKSMRLYMTDAQDHRLILIDVSQRDLTEYTASFQWTIDQKAMITNEKPTKLNCVIAGRTEETTVPFEFRDIPFPESMK